jgi:5-(carboxyamino)imidazole ribonucleotide synthase
VQNKGVIVGMSSPLDAFPIIGILGGGQLGRMMALEAIRMGFHVRFLSPTPEGPMIGLGESLIGDWLNPDLLRSFGEGCAAITVESEWAPAEVAEEALEGRVPVRPSSSTLEIVRHKGRQKEHLTEAGLPVPSFRCCTSFDEAREAVRQFHYPVVAKQYRRSYDGYGNAMLRSEDELRNAWGALASDDGLMIEAFVPFEQELSVLVARRPGGEHVVYPVAHTEQRDHRCHAVVVPAEAEPAVLAEAKRVGLAAVDAVGGVGLTAVELFQASDGSVLINELAPRPHNTGHYSIEACYTSQFENHIRAVLDLPLGNADLREPVAVMINLLGMRDGAVEPNGLAEALDIPGARVHLYGKPNVRPKRKMGHVTVTGRDRGEVRFRAERAASLIQL